MEQGTWVVLIPVIVVANKPEQLRSWYTAIGVCVCVCATYADGFRFSVAVRTVHAGDEALTGVLCRFPRVWFLVTSCSTGLQ